VSIRFLAGHGGFEESIEGLHASSIDNVSLQEMQRFLLEAILSEIHGLLPPVIAPCLRGERSMRMDIRVAMAMATQPVSVGFVSTMLRLRLKYHWSLTRTSRSYMLMPVHSNCEMAMLTAEIRPTRPGTVRIFQTTEE
jgi:hypothetical protein